MARLGIVIAASEYSGSLQNLPACRRDGQAVSDMLSHTGRFDEILHLSGGNETVSSSVKTQLSGLADRFRGAPIEEIVFYFSGHGDFDGEEFRYVLSDYNHRRTNQTTLANSELDSIFRSLNPSLFVKIVDACNSGINYVKGDADFTSYLKSANTSFANVYFMFSSQANESSYATDYVSDFTESLIKGVVNAPDGPVRYRDLMSAVSDDFAGTGSGQTPQFVVQATNTEIFCEASPALRDLLESYLETSEADVAGPAKSSTLLERIQQEEKEYCTKEVADQILRSIIDKILDQKPSADLDALFSVSVHQESGIAPSGNYIGTWLSDNGDKGLFAKPTRRSEVYTERVPKNTNTIFQSMSNFLTADLDDDKLYKTVERSRMVVDSYRITTQQEYGHLILELEPKLSAIAPARCYIAPLISRRDLVLFWRYVNFDYSDWNSTIPRTSSKWARAETRLRNEESIDAVLTDIWEGFEVFVLNPLIERWPAPIALSEALNEDPTAAEAGSEKVSSASKKK